MPKGLARWPSPTEYIRPPGGQTLPQWSYSFDSFEEPALVSGLRVVCPSFAPGSRCATVTRL